MYFKSIFAGCVLAAQMAAMPAVAIASTDDIRIVVNGEDNDAVNFWKDNGFWGPVDPDVPLKVPRALVAAVDQGWADAAKDIPVDLKKQLFYRAAVPLVLYANSEIRHDRGRMVTIAESHAAGTAPSTDDMAFLKRLAAEYKVAKDGAGDDEVLAALDELKKRVDSVPPSLALGQAAYESGYWTSRFALLGNALFGQWTFDGKGMRPEQHRSEKGNYGVASFDWPLDSVRAYMNNLNTHRGYAELRDLRAELRGKGEPLTGKALATTLTSYSERGQEYVDTLQSIMRVNHLYVADNASFKDEPITLVVYTLSAENKQAVIEHIEQMRQSGELEAAIDSMRLTQ